MHGGMRAGHGTSRCKREDRHESIWVTGFVSGRMLDESTVLRQWNFTVQG